MTFHPHFDVDTPFRRARVWARCVGGAALTEAEWLRVQEGARARGWSFIPTCDNPDSTGKCAGHEDAR